jgi:hypothetical protein
LRMGSEHLLGRGLLGTILLLVGGVRMRVVLLLVRVGLRMLLGRMVVIGLVLRVGVAGLLAAVRLLLRILLRLLLLLPHIRIVLYIHQGIK